MVPNLNDFYIKSKETGGIYSDTEIIEDDLVKVIVQKYLMLIYTNKGEVLGNPDFGCNLEELIYQTSINEDGIRDIINEQIYFFIPELADVGYSLNLQFVQDDEEYRDVLLINFSINDYDVYNIISDR